MSSDQLERQGDWVQVAMKTESIREFSFIRVVQKERKDGEIHSLSGVIDLELFRQYLNDGCMIAFAPRRAQSPTFLRQYQLLSDTFPAPPLFTLDHPLPRLPHPQYQRKPSTSPSIPHTEPQSPLLPPTVSSPLDYPRHQIPSGSLG